MSITGTLIIQIIVFLLLVGFTMKYVWPPIATALDERSAKIAEGLAAADRAKTELAAANAKVDEELGKSRHQIAGLLADAERRAQAIVDQAKHRATEEASKIVASAHAEAEQQSVQAREALREQVAALAVKGAEQILRKEVDAGVHAELLNRLKTEL
ncbi:MAG: F0F1 ATP synthase subunit B [Ramlibacter sp.]